MKTTLKLSLLAAASILAACGGGGGGGGGSSTGTTPVVPVATVAGTLATSVPTPTYAAASSELALFNELNAVRLAGGFGMLAQDPLIDKAALNHANYSSTYFWGGFVNGDYPNRAIAESIDPATGWLTAHIENPVIPGFTGIKPIDRVTAAGGTQYTYVGEVVGGGGPNYLTCVSELLNTVFHRSGLLSTLTQTVGFGTSTAAAGGMPSCVIEYGHKAQGNTVPSGWNGVYPLSGQTNVPINMPSEAPDPAPDIPWASKGSPVSIYLESRLSTVNSFTLTAAGSTVPVPVKITVQADNPTYFANNEAHLQPRQVLAKGTVYTASFSGTLASGANVNKIWSFTTTVN